MVRLWPGLKPDLPAPPAALYRVTDNALVAMTPNYLLLDHDAAYLMMPVTMPMPGHCRLRHRNGHRCCQYRRTCQRKEEFLHQNRAPLTPSPFLMPLAQQLPARAGTVFNAENAIRSRRAAPFTSLTPVKSPFNHRANTGPQCPVVFFMRKTDGSSILLSSCLV